MRERILKKIAFEEDLDIKKLQNCMIIIFDDQSQAVVVGENQISKLQQMLNVVHNVLDECDYNIDDNYVIHEDDLLKPNVYTNLMDFFEAYPKYLKQYFYAIEKLESYEELYY